MMKSARISVAIAIVSVMLLAACGADKVLLGGGESGTGLTPVAFGKITGFGSVFVNGVEFDTVGSRIDLDGVTENESKLKIGMVVLVNGSVNADGKTGVAQLIEFNDNVDGIVESVTVETNGNVTLRVLGQTVIATASTMIEGVISRANLIPVGSLVEVSGHTSGDGVVYATFVNVKKNSVAADEEMEVKGIVTAWDSVAQTFKIGALVINSGATTLKNISELRNDVYVKAKGKYDSATSRLIATEVEFKSEKGKRLTGEAGSHIELEGIVTKIVTPGEVIEINGQSVRFAAILKSSVLSLAVGSEIEVEGKFELDGTIFVSTFEEEKSADLEITTTVQSVDAANNQFSLLGSTVNITNSTQMKDGTGIETSFTINKLYAGNRVKVSLYRDNTGKYYAASLERRSVDNENYDEIRGVISAIPVAGQYQVGGFLVKDPNNLVTAQNYTVGNYVEFKIQRQINGDIVINRT